MFLQIILLNKFTLSYSNTGVRSVNLTDMRSCYHSVEIRSTIQSHAHASQHHLFKDYSFFVVSIRQQSRSNSSSTLLSQSHFFVSSYVVFAVQSSLHAWSCRNWLHSTPWTACDWTMFPWLPRVNHYFLCCDVAIDEQSSRFVHVGCVKGKRACDAH
jgi:hypothetical protein